MARHTLHGSAAASCNNPSGMIQGATPLALALCINKEVAHMGGTTWHTGHEVFFVESMKGM